MTLRPQGVVGSFGPDAVDLAASCGMFLDDWQGGELYWALSYRADGSWACKDYCLICSRQNGKNVILEARELYGLVVLGERILHTAHEFPTAVESFRALDEMILANPSILRQRTDRHASIATGYDMRFRSGGLIQYKARTGSSGRGFRGIDLLTSDEVQHMNDDHQGALLPTTSSKANAQKWYTGSAPDIGSTVLHRLRSRLRAGEQGPLGGAEISADPDANLDDHLQWRQANPSHRVTDETIASERLAMSDEQFARERLSISPDLMEAGGPFGPAWAKVCDDAAIAIPLMFGVDVNLERTAAAIVACGAGPVLSVVDYRPGTDWLVDRCKELRSKYKCRFVVDRGGPIGSFVDEMNRQRLRLVELDSTDTARASGHIFDAVKADSVTIRTNDDLDRAVSGAEKQAVGDAFRWGRKGSASDICLLVAATVALWGEAQKQRAKLVSMADLLCPKCKGIKADCGCEVTE